MALGDFLGSGDASHASRSSIDLKLDFDCQLNRLQLLDETCGICTSGQDRQIMWSLQSPLGKKVMILLHGHGDSAHCLRRKER